MLLRLYRTILGTACITATTAVLLAGASVAQAKVPSLMSQQTRVVTMTVQRQVQQATRPATQRKAALPANGRSTW